MKFFSTFVALFLSCLIFHYHCNAQPVDQAAAAGIVIDAAPSVVSYQGSSQAHAHLVLAPMGRSLGYVEPLDVNRTLARNERLDERHEVLDISPVYVPE
ncbi:PREDICTED: uncharacterized protein LOC108359350 [Rhagoletis zephyria]|uniref:uncharacterized protein LOC108359350 n=1 Tax=Rhagoletis zephyria TaxID=28612 RepID=UPI00081170C0|nr:PREDICTED: uncharacterized protein LOC108359350 [Rhagoletis zephyria]XP_036337796.1 uncharacterized protein LOC118747776 [Rhagoletis pomonella]